MLAFISIFIALGVGYLIADFAYKGEIWRRYGHHLNKYQNLNSSAKHGGYYEVLTSVLKEQPDEGFDAFFDSMEVSAQTFDVHIALASMLRRRGEFARAVKVHENLLKHDELADDKIHQVQLELATDYWRSGMLDRAETILKQLIDIPSLGRSLRWRALAYLVEIYQDLEQWLDAIDMADCLTEKKFSAEPDLWRVLQAQFSCELAERANRVSDIDTALSKSKQALQYDPQCVRAKLLLGELSYVQEDRTSALSYLLPIATSNPEYISELIEPLSRYLNADKEKYSEILLELVATHHSIVALLALSQQHENKTTFVPLWCDTLLANSDAMSQLKIMKLALEESQEARIHHVVTELENYLGDRLDYLCKNCGAEYSKMQWRCVSCNSWATIHSKVS